MKTANREFMREWNRKLVLRQIRKEKETSQINLVKKTKLSAGTIVNITKQLRKEGFIRYTGKGKSLSGRRPEKFCFNSDARHVISVALFALETKISVIDLNGKIKHKLSYPTEHEKGEKTVLTNLAKQVKSTLLKYSIPKEKLNSLSVSIEGSVDEETGCLKISSHFGWKNVPVRDTLEKMLGCKTFIESEGRAMALGEYYFGAGKKADSMLCVDIDSGIGTAFIKNGEVYHGAHNLEAELGHSLVLEDGPLCRCGRKGCLEVVSSGSAIIKRTEEMVRTGRIKKQGSLAKISGLPEREAIRIIFEMAEKKDAAVLKILEDAGYYLGLSIANMITYVDPEIIVLTGYVSEEDPGVFLNIVDKVYKEKLFLPNMRKTKIVKSALGEDSVLIGGAAVAYKGIFE
ncbi:MAG: ROK family transcriptional regulator [Candidatus Omnitrophica bacterium]|nr:ROK family transcriptional regulator [Candidatus Omnitrophota bacterium]